MIRTEEYTKVLEKKYLDLLEMFEEYLDRKDLRFFEHIKFSSEGELEEFREKRVRSWSKSFKDFSKTIKETLNPQTEVGMCVDIRFKDSEISNCNE